MSIINEITIKGFKSIQDQTISLGQMNVLIGTNGAGKSNFLEAIAMLSSSAEGGIDYQKLSSKGARLSSPEIFKSAFRNVQRKAFFQLQVKIDHYEYDMKINPTTKFSYFSEKFTDNGDIIAKRSYAGAKLNNNTIANLEPTKSILGIMQNFDESYNEPINSLKRFSIYSPSTPILRGVSTDNSFHEPLGLYGGGLAKALLELIQDKDNSDELLRFFKLLDWFQQIGITNPDNMDVLPEQGLLGNTVVSYRDKFMSLKFNELYAYDVSEGALYILFVLVLLAHKRSPNIFALDNIDSTLNPGLVRELMMHITEMLDAHQEKQIFITTHNPTTLDAIDLFNTQHRLFVVSRSNTGQTELKRIEPPENMTKKEWEENHYGLKLSEIWLSGAIGGLPKGF